MKHFLLIVGVLCWAVAALGFVAAPTAIQEGIAALVGVSGSVLVAGAAIVSAIEDLPQAVKPAKNDELSTGG